MYNAYTLADAAKNYYSTGANKSQRFGQFFYNRYIHTGKPWPELFYETDNAKAIEMIVNYIEENQNA